MNRDTSYGSRLRWLAGMAVAAFAPAALAQVHSGDIILGEQDGRIVVGAVQGSGSIDWEQRVFGAEFDIGGDFTTNPGFDTPDGTFPAGLRIGFNIRKALRVWTPGTVDPAQGHFDTIPVEQIEIDLFPVFGPVVTPLTDQIVPGFSLPVNAGGEFHHHYGFFLTPPAGEGVYLLELEKWSDNAAYGTSEPFWMVFNQNAPGTQFADAIAYAREVIAGGGGCAADLTGSSDPNDASFGVPDGDADGDDFFFYLDSFSIGQLGVCDLTGSSDPNDATFGAPDGDCDGDDFFFYLDLFQQGCS
ncbi:MAG: GC-type dockerin domain-anchored protein [Phycisphaerales bacterium JB037]